MSAGRRNDPTTPRDRDRATNTAAETGTKRASTRYPASNTHIAMSQAMIVRRSPQRSADAPPTSVSNSGGTNPATMTAVTTPAPRPDAVHDNAK